MRPLIADCTIQLELEKVYTRLKIISRPKADDPSSGKEVNVYDLFREYEKGEDVMALAEGSPGIGKTTLCLKLAYDWAVKSATTAIAFPKFDLVLLLKCRDIDGDIMEAISEQLLPEDINEEKKKTVLDFIKDIDNQERILIILDGLDELPQKSKHHVNKLLHRRILPFCYVFVTSRQERGIEVRKNFKFDILLEIEGFTESDACEYIRKHFKHFRPDLLSKGEKLIEEIKENTFLHALRNNPLNLLLLCVIYEDYEGKLPSSRTELYQVIVQYLLRRYCAKHDMNAPEQDKDLEKQFKKEILALGNLAWKCLLQDRHSFREDELKEMEKRNENLVARRLGLLYKEESLKRLKPQHEYYFLHKTFQEYLAACYIAHKLRRKKFNVFEDLTFDDLVAGDPQVLLFVSGLLGEEASLLFEQIGKELKDDWDWEQCKEESAEFFVNCFSESENGDQIASTLCSFIPFPLDVNLEISEDLPCDFADVLSACKRFSNLQTPVNLSCTVDNSDLAALILDLLDSCKQLKTFSITCKYKFEELANDLFCSLATSTSLSQLTLDVSESISSDTAAMIESHLTEIKSLTQVALKFPGSFGTAWLSVLGTGLTAHTPLTSVLLTVCGPMNETAIQALEKLLSNESLTSLSFTFRGDMQDLLAAALSRGLAGKICIRSLDLCVEGKLSYYGAKLLERGLLENRSSNDLKVLLHGERPENWCSVVEKVRLAKKSQVSFGFYTDTFSKVTANQVAHFRPFVVDKRVCPNQHLTVNVCGELTIEGADALCEVLCPSLSRLTVNLYGKLTDGFSHLSTRCNDQPKTPSSVTFNIWGKLTEEEKILSQDIKDKNPAITVNVHDVPISQDDSTNDVNVTISNPASWATLVTEVKNTRKEKLSLSMNNRVVALVDWVDVLGEDSSLKELVLTINDETLESEEWSTGPWDCGLGDGLKCNKSLRELTLTVNQYGFTNRDWGKSLGYGLKCNKSIHKLTLTVSDYGHYSILWGKGLGYGLKCNTSLRELTLTVNQYGFTNRDWGKSLGYGLKCNKSIRKLTLTVSDYGHYSILWGKGLGYGLKCNTSLRELTLTVNQYGFSGGEWGMGLGDGLKCNTSIRELTLTVNQYHYHSREWGMGLGDGLKCNTSIRKLTLTVNQYGGTWGMGLGDGLKCNTSIRELTLTINNYDDFSGFELEALGEGLATSKSLTSCNLVFSMHGRVEDDYLPTFCEHLMRSESLATLTLQVTDPHLSNGSRDYDLSKVLVKSKSLSSIDLTVSFYGTEPSTSDTSDTAE